MKWRENDKYTWILSAYYEYTSYTSKVNCLFQISPAIAHFAQLNKQLGKCPTDPNILEHNINQSTLSCIAFRQWKTLYT